MLVNANPQSPCNDFFGSWYRLIGESHPIYCKIVNCCATLLDVANFGRCRIHGDTVPSMEPAMMMVGSPTAAGTGLRKITQKRATNKSSSTIILLINEYILYDIYTIVYRCSKRFVCNRVCLYREWTVDVRTVVPWHRRAIYKRVRIVRWAIIIICSCAPLNLRIIFLDRLHSQQNNSSR
jgi:hypothetical protein